MLTLEVTRTAQPPARAHQDVTAAEYLRVIDAIEELGQDWLYRIASPEGRAKLLAERGIHITAR
jgi:hypothetical protein